MPFDTINQWIEQEKKMGSPAPDMVVLATASKIYFYSLEVETLSTVTEYTLQDKHSYHHKFLKTPTPTPLSTLVFMYRIGYDP